MSALDTAKEIVRIGSTAGLSKDVIDLLEKKATLLAEQNVDLARQLSVSHQKIATLEAEVAQLRQQFQDAQPVGFEENMGVLWKSTATGFEKIPYCKHCAGNPVMSPIHRANKWVCGSGNHFAPLSVRPPPVEPQVTGLPPQEDPLE